MTQEAETGGSLEPSQEGLKTNLGNNETPISKMITMFITNVYNLSKTRHYPNVHQQYLNEQIETSHTMKYGSAIKYAQR